MACVLIPFCIYALLAVHDCQLIDFICNPQQMYSGDHKKMAQHGSSSSMSSSSMRDPTRQHSRNERTDRSAPTDRPHPSNPAQRPPNSSKAILSDFERSQSHAHKNRIPNALVSRTDVSGMRPHHDSSKPHHSQQSQPMQHQQRPSTSASANKPDNRSMSRDPKLHSDMSSKGLSANRMTVSSQFRMLYPP